MWIKTVYGYVKQKAIIEVYINKSYPGIVFASLSSGDSVTMADYGDNAECAEAYLSELMRILIGESWYDSDLVRTLP